MLIQVEDARSNEGLGQYFTNKSHQCKNFCSYNRTPPAPFHYPPEICSRTLGKLLEQIKGVYGRGNGENILLHKHKFLKKKALALHWIPPFVFSQIFSCSSNHVINVACGIFWYENVFQSFLSFIFINYCKVGRVEWFSFPALAYCSGGSPNSSWANFGVHEGGGGRKPCCASRSLWRH